MSEQLVRTSCEDTIYTVTLARPEKRNAISDRLLEAIEGAFAATPEDVRVIVLAADGEHFCAGLDLTEHQHREPFGVMKHSQGWHRVFNRIQNGGIPVVAALHGAVIGGGLELAAATHVRVAGPPLAGVGRPTGVSLDGAPSVVHWAGDSSSMAAALTRVPVRVRIPASLWLTPTDA